MELKQVKRITIVGGPGTGKKKNKKKLGTIFNLPIIHIDGINYNPNWEKVEELKISTKKNKKFLGAKKESVANFFNMWLHIEEKREIKL